MLLPFYQKSKQKLNEHETAQDKLAIRLVQQCLKIQEKWANFLQYKTEGLSCRLKLVGLAFFCLLSGGYSTYLVTHNFTRHSLKTNLFTSLKYSLPVTQTKIGNLPHAVVISPAEFKKLQQLRILQDSLSPKTSGKKIQDPFPDSVPE